MNNPNLVLYGMNRLGPYHILDYVDDVRATGFTTIVLGMLHIGNPVVKSTTQLGDIIFNGDEPLVIRDGERPFPLVTGEQHVACMAWPGRVAALDHPGRRRLAAAAGHRLDRRVPGPPP